MNWHERMQKAIQEYNPYEFEGTRRVFIHPEDYHDFNAGKIVIASTERFFPSDITVYITKDELKKVSNGGVVVTIKKENTEETNNG